MLVGQVVGPMDELHPHGYLDSCAFICHCGSGNSSMGRKALEIGSAVKGEDRSMRTFTGAELLPDPGFEMAVTITSHWTFPTPTCFP